MRARHDVLCGALDPSWQARAAASRSEPGRNHRPRSARTRRTPKIRTDSRRAPSTPGARLTRNWSGPREIPRARGGPRRDRFPALRRLATFREPWALTSNRSTALGGRDPLSRAAGHTGGNSSRVQLGVGHETDERPAAVRSLVYFLLCSPSQPRRRWRRERSPSSQGRVGRGSSSPAPSVCNSCTNLASHRRKIRASWRAALGARNPATNRNRGGAAERARRHTRLPGKLFQSIERSRAANFLTSKRDFFRAWGPFSSVVRTQRSSRRRYPYERTETM